MEDNPNDFSNAQTSFKVGDRVRIDMERYVKWYNNRNQPFGRDNQEAIHTEQSDGENMEIWGFGENGKIHVKGNGWGGAIPPQFLSLI